LGKGILMQALKGIFSGIGPIVGALGGGGGGGGAPGSASTGTPLFHEGPPIYGPGRYPFDEKPGPPNINPATGETMDPHDFESFLKFVRGA
jgi:hypothetical protein